MVAPPSGPPPQATAQLPERWKAHWNPQYNAWYYENIYTEASVWEKPTQAVNPPQKTAPLPPGPPPPGYQVGPQPSQDPTTNLTSTMVAVSISNDDPYRQQQNTQGSLRISQQAAYGTPPPPQLYNPAIVPAQDQQILPQGSSQTHQPLGSAAQYYAHAPGSAQVPQNAPPPQVPGGAVAQMDNPNIRRTPVPTYGSPGLSQNGPIPSPVPGQRNIQPPAASQALYNPASSPGSQSQQFLSPTASGPQRNNPSLAPHTMSQNTPPAPNEYASPPPRAASTRDANLSLGPRPNSVQPASGPQPYGASPSQYGGPQQRPGPLQQQPRPVQATQASYPGPPQFNQTTPPTQQQAPLAKKGLMGMFQNKVGSKMPGGAAAGLLGAGAGLLGGAFLKHEWDDQEAKEKRQQQQAQYHQNQQSQGGAVAVGGVTGLAGGAGLVSLGEIKGFFGGPSVVEVPVTEQVYTSDVVVDNTTYFAEPSFVTNSFHVDNTTVVDNNFVQNDTTYVDSSYVSDNTFVQDDTFVQNSFVENSTYVSDDTYVQDNFVADSSFTETDLFADVSYTETDFYAETETDTAWAC